MTSFLQTVFLVCLADVAVSTSTCNKNLIAVVQLFRHGQRTPIQFYANDPYYNRTYWGGIGSGQLTDEGKRQQHALGEFTRRRYQDWLPEKYNHEDFYARTTDVDRTHMSALSNIYGLYPAINDQIWHPLTNWQPIPLHTADPNILNALPYISCKSYYVEMANFISENESLAIDEKYAYIYDYLTEKSGNNITRYTEIQTLFDCLEIENNIGLPLPDWTLDIYPQPITDLCGLLFDSYSHTTRLQRLSMGPFLNEIVEYLEGMSNDPLYSQKFQMYSAHDYNLSGFLNSLGAYNPPHPIPVASSIYIELRKNNGSYFVNVWYKDNDDLKPISIKGCTLDCPLNEVRERLNDILIDVEAKNDECKENIEFVNELAEENYKKMVNKTKEKRNQRKQNLKKRFLTCG